MSRSCRRCGCVVLYQELHNFVASINSYKNFLLLNKNSKHTDTVRRAKFNIAICYFTIRNFSKGEKYYRFRHEENILDIYRGIPLWTPGTNNGKVLIWDDNCIISSFNFLSFKGSRDMTYRNETGIFFQHDVQFVDETWEKMLSYIMEKAEN